MSLELLSFVLVMQARDLHEWEESPESFHHEADVGSWEDHLRSCAETLFGVLLEVRFHTNPHVAGHVPYAGGLAGAWR